MPRAYTHSDYADTAQDPGAGEWQALRGELVALLDKVGPQLRGIGRDRPWPLGHVG